MIAHARSALTVARLMVLALPPTRRASVMLAGPGMTAPQLLVHATAMIMDIALTALAIVRSDGLERHALKRHAQLIATIRDIVSVVLVFVTPNTLVATAQFSSALTDALAPVLALTLFASVRLSGLARTVRLEVVPETATERESVTTRRATVNLGTLEPTVRLAPAPMSVTATESVLIGRVSAMKDTWELTAV